MDKQEIRLRCIEAAARNPTPHPKGYAAGILEAAQEWEAWVGATQELAGEPAKNGVSELL